MTGKIILKKKKEENALCEVPAGVVNTSPIPICNDERSVANVLTSAERLSDLRISSSNEIAESDFRPILPVDRSSTIRERSKTISSSTYTCSNEVLPPTVHIPTAIRQSFMHKEHSTIGNLNQVKLGLSPYTAFNNNHSSSKDIFITERPSSHPTCIKTSLQSSKNNEYKFALPKSLWYMDVKVTAEVDISYTVLNVSL